MNNNNFPSNNKQASNSNMNRSINAQQPNKYQSLGATQTLPRQTREANIRRSGQEIPHNPIFNKQSLGATQTLPRQTREANIRRSGQEAPHNPTLRKVISEVQQANLPTLANLIDNKSNDFLTAEHIRNLRRHKREAIVSLLLLIIIISGIFWYDSKLQQEQRIIDTKWSETEKLEKDRILNLVVQERHGGSVIMPNFIYLGKKKYVANNYTEEVEEYLHKPTSIEFVFIPAKSFTMGDPAGIRQHFERAARTRIVKFQEPFLISKYPCTQGIWKAVMGEEPWRTSKGCLKKANVARMNTQVNYNAPASFISWQDCQQFCQKFTLDNFRLPSESEWEYACRGGSAAKYFYGNHHESLVDYAWHLEDKSKNTFPQEVGQKKPNAYGLYDMYGNICEWCEDDWTENYGIVPDDGTAYKNPSGSEIKVHRGGDYTVSAIKAQSANNYDSADENTASASIGVRFCVHLSKEALNNLKQQEEAKKKAIEEVKEAEKRAKEEAEKQRLREEEEKQNNELQAPVVNKTKLHNKIIKLGFDRKNAAKSLYVHKATGMEFILLTGGIFTMGNDDNKNEQPAHQVRIMPFLMSKYPCTQSTWKKVMKTTPWKNKGNIQSGPNYPAVYITWNDAQEFCKKTKLQLPTEAQWEYACRAGSEAKYCFGDKDEDLQYYAWYQNNISGQRRPQKVGQKKPNAFGLYDMHGNICELCQDTWHADYQDAPTDGRAWVSKKNGTQRVYRGGSYLSTASDCSSSHRYYLFQNASNHTTGVRFVFNLGE